MPELKLNVPTYYGAAFVSRDDATQLPDFGKPKVPLLARSAEGIRIVLGSHDFEDCSVPDIQVERRPNGWAIFLHPVGGGDPCGFVYFLDDGRSFLLKECPNSTPEIELVESNEEIAEIDDLSGIIGDIDQLSSQRIKEIIGDYDDSCETDDTDAICPIVIFHKES